MERSMIMSLYASRRINNAPITAASLTIYAIGNSKY